MTATTRLAYKQDILNVLNPRLSSMLRGFVMPLTSTATAADRLSLRDTRLDRTARSTNAFDRMTVEIIETTSGSPAVGEVATITAYDATDKVTTTPAFSDEVQSGMDYLLYPDNLSPEQLNQAIRDVLRSTETLHSYFPSMLTDAAANMSGIVGTDWPEEGSGVTSSYDTSAVTTPRGVASLRIETTVVDTGCRTAGIAVHETESTILSLLIGVPTGSAVVQLYDVTNSVVIDESGVLNDNALTEVLLRSNIPDDCEQVEVRVIARTAVSDIYVAAGVTLQSTTTHLYVMPSWFIREEQFLQAVIFPSGRAAEASDAYIAHGSSIGVGVPDFISDARAVHGFAASFAALSYPIGFEVYRGFDELTDNTTTSNCDREYVKWKVCANVLKSMGDNRWREHDSDARSLIRGLKYGERRKVLSESPKVRI